MIPTVVWLLLLASVLPWRQADFYGGGLDAVVVGKAGLSGLAALIALLAVPRVSHPPAMGVRSVLLVGGYLAATVLGAWSAGMLAGGLVLALRTALLGLTVVVLVCRFGVIDVMRSLRMALIVVGVVLAVLGLGQLRSQGRLGTTAISPNQLAMIFGTVVLLTLWGILGHRRLRCDVAVLLVFLVLVWLTGSRTGLTALVLGIVFMMLLSGRLPSSMIVGVVAAIPVVAYLLTATGFVSGYFNRGGGHSVTTLNSRTIAWKAAFEGPYEFWSFLFGRGLSARTVGVQGTYWDKQVLDSSWVSAYVQAGAVGLCLLAVWALTTLVASASVPRPGRSLFLPLTIFLIVFSITASGLIDSYPLFLVMLLASIGSERATREVEQRASPDSAARV